MEYPIDNGLIFLPPLTFPSPYGASIIRPKWRTFERYMMGISDERYLIRLGQTFTKRKSKSGIRLELPVERPLMLLKTYVLKLVCFKIFQNGSKTYFKACKTYDILSPRLCKKNLNYNFCIQIIQRHQNTKTLYNNSRLSIAIATFIVIPSSSD